MPELNSFIQKAFLTCNLGLAIIFFVIDEPLHWKRGLAVWEKISHPVDALCSAGTFAVGFLACKYQTSALFWGYCLAAVITILMTFKDEFVHKEQCTAHENLVHAVMFSLNAAAHGFGAVLILTKGPAALFLLGAVFALVTMAWQIGFWFFWRKAS